MKTNVMVVDLPDPPEDVWRNIIYCKVDESRRFLAVCRERCAIPEKCQNYHDRLARFGLDMDGEF